MISIHAPAKGATSALGCAGRRFAYFNPRSREGSDPVQIDLVQLNAISIHAPAKGATHAAPRCIAIKRHFNPRSREGSDASVCSITLSHLTFQSTLPRRERLIAQ